MPAVAASGILHWYCAAPECDSLLDLCAAVAGPDDTVVLLGEGVRAALAAAPALPDQGTWLAMKGDLAAQGIADTQLKANVGLIETDELVRLTCRYPKVQSWP